MVTCPWCGTTYVNFQSNCNNCGGPLARPSPSEVPEDDQIIWPPPVPRPVSDNFAWKLLIADGWGIAGGILSFLGLIFSVLGFILTIAIVTAFVGIPFLLLGLVFLGVGGFALFNRYNHARQTVLVLQQGEPIRGQLTSVERDYSVQVNNRNPWVLRYRFTLAGVEYLGRVATLNDPDPALRAGSAVCILYDPIQPAQNALYPHP